MAIDVTWHMEEQNLIYWHVSGDWTLDEFYHAVSETIRLSNEAANQANALVDALNVGKRPSGNLLIPFRHALTRCDLGTVVYVQRRTNSKLVEVLVNMVLRTVPGIRVKSFRFAYTIEDALAIIANRIKD